jgi:2-polyprenyl-6-methoxyphenol hydroxylase-like FAD-dependent oxidoreductase
MVSRYMVLSAWQDEVMALKVVVIGAGVIGSSVALAMARAGHDVVVVDRNSSAGIWHGRHITIGNAGLNS